MLILTEQLPFPISIAQRIGSYQALPDRPHPPSSREFSGSSSPSARSAFEGLRAYGLRVGHGKNDSLLPHNALADVNDV
jgi:hypothetical protein